MTPDRLGKKDFGYQGYLKPFLSMGVYSTESVREGIDNQQICFNENFSLRGRPPSPPRVSEKNTSNIFWTQDHQWGTFGENMIFPLEKLKILRKILKNLKK